MKKLISSLVVLCIIISSFMINASAFINEDTDVIYMVKTTENVDLTKYKNGAATDFFGIEIVSIEEIEDNIYHVATKSRDSIKVIELWRANEKIEQVVLLSYIPQRHSDMILLRVTKDIGSKQYENEDVFEFHNISFDSIFCLTIRNTGLTKQEILEKDGYLEFVGMIDDIHTNPDIYTAISMLKAYDDVVYIEPLFSDLHPDFNYKSIDELTYHGNEILIKTNRYIDLSEISKNYNMVCGVIVSEARLLLDDTSKENALKVLNEQGYLEYFIKAYCSLNTIDTVKYLNTRSDVIQATPYYVPYEPNKGLYFHDDNYEYEAHVVLLYTDRYIEPFEYTENAVDFYGVPLRELELIHADALYTVDEWLDMGYDLFYAAQTDESMGVADAVEILSDVDGITNAFPSGLMYPDICLGTRTPGDVNDNGEIDMTDYILLKRVYFGTYTVYDNAPVRCDVNMDDKITITDYILLKRIYFGTYTL